MGETVEATNERSVLISGGSRGLGQALVEALLAHGYRVATFSRTRSEFIAATQQRYDTSRFLYQAIDAQQPEALRQFVSLTYQQFGRIDALINNAAIAIDGVLALSRDEDIERMLDVNLKSALLLAKECSRLMLLQREGHILNIASIIAERGFSGLATYAATKAGLLGMTRALARELGPRNIRVNALAPGYLETEMSAALGDEQRQQIVRRTPLGRLGTAADVVPWVLFLLSPASQFVTGQTILIDGGASV